MFRREVGLESSKTTGGVLRPALPNLRGRRTIGRMIEVFLEPLVVLAWLAGFALWFHVLEDARWVLAVVLAFALSYPGVVRLSDRKGSIARNSVTTALSIIAGLSLLIFASAWTAIAPRREVLAWFAALPVLLFAAQIGVRAALRGIARRIGWRPNIVICGVNAIGSHLATHFSTFPYFGARFLGFFDDRQRERLAPIGDRPLLGKFGDLGDYVRRQRVDQVYFALPMASHPRIMEMLRDSQDSTASIFFVPDLFMTEIINCRVAEIAGLPAFSVRETPFDGPNHLIKRLEDIVLSLICIACAAPMMLLVAIGVRLSSPGDILFRQKRYGIDGREIIVYKFRSMTVNEDGATAYTQVTRGDSRVTRFGRFIRRTSLDELPQLINVLQGRMSLVGPRPHVAAVNEAYRRLIPGYMARHIIKPGLTGLAQVRGFRGGDDLDGMMKRVAADIEYVRNWSVILDLEILLRTVVVLWRDRRAF
jgi:putative colanic acid biosynthesis UDP-glucose lipid carrier transferase